MLALAALITVSTMAKTARIGKVLQHLEDAEGRIALQPSLYERDAYQALLRESPEKVRALRFEVNWGGVVKNTKRLTLRMEVVGANTAPGKPAVYEQVVRNKGIFTNWSVLRVDKEAYEKLGRVVSWRATLWDGEKLIAEQKSFLWDSTPVKSTANAAH